MAASQSYRKIKNERINRSLLLLGLKHGSSVKELKTAYYNKAKAIHPDRNKDRKEEATAKFQELKDAYEFLLQNGTSPVVDFDTFSSAFFGFTRSKKRSRTQAPKHITRELAVSLTELYTGCVRTLNVKTTRTCNECKGNSKKRVLKTVECSACNSRGFVTVTETFKSGIHINKKCICSSCEGKGGSSYLEDSCSACCSTGVIKSEYTLNVHIKPGARWGTKLVFKNPDNINGPTHVNFIFIVLKKPSQVKDIFELRGNHLYMEKTVSIWDALTGCNFSITHLDGTVYRLCCDSSSLITPDQQQRVVRGLGMPNSDGSCGDLIIAFNITYPVMKPSLMQRIRTLLQEEDVLPQKSETCDNEKCLDMLVMNKVK